MSSQNSSFSLYSSTFGISGGEEDDDVEEDDDDSKDPSFHLSSNSGGGSVRPEMKRRRTIPDILALRTPVRGNSFGAGRGVDGSGMVVNGMDVDRRGNGKDGQDVWPEDVEDAFHNG